MARANHCTLSLEAREWINGELLGDGSLGPKNRPASSYFHNSKHLEYCEYVKDTLQSFGIQQGGTIRKYIHKEGNSVYCYTSHSYRELRPIYDKWYPEGRKIVPRDIKLTPLTCRQWYIGDGNLSHKGRANPCIRLCTDAFPTYDVVWLVERLQKLGFLATRQPANNRIQIAVYSTKDFLNYIGECPVACYQYKFDYEGAY